MNRELQYHSAGAYKVIDSLSELPEVKLRELSPLLSQDPSQLRENIKHLKKYVSELELCSMQDKTLL